MIIITHLTIDLLMIIIALSGWEWLLGRKRRWHLVAPRSLWHPCLWHPVNAQSNQAAKDGGSNGIWRALATFGDIGLQLVWVLVLFLILVLGISVKQQ